MEAIKQNGWSSAGILLGAVALIMGLFHFTLGPFAARPSLESIVAEQVSAVRKGIIAGIKGVTPEVEKKKSATLNIDRILNNVGPGLALAGLLCSFIAGIRGERRLIIYAAVVCGGVTLAFHTILFGISVIFAILGLLFIIILLSAIAQ